LRFVTAPQQLEQFEPSDFRMGRLTEGRRVDVDQVEIAAAGGTGQKFDRTVGNDVDRVQTMRTLDVHGIGPVAGDVSAESAE
jgi:hypothetical protein